MKAGARVQTKNRITFSATLYFEVICMGLPVIILLQKSKQAKKIRILWSI